MSIVGNMVGCYSPMGKTFIIEDADGNEIVGIVVDQETLITATAADIVAGKTAGTEEGIVVGTHEC
jgi:hypothetical protein